MRWLWSCLIGLVVSSCVACPPLAYDDIDNTDMDVGLDVTDVVRIAWIK